MENTGTIYLAPHGYGKELEMELALAGLNVTFQRQRLIGVKEKGFQPVWAENTWLQPELIIIQSINDAATALKARGRNWALYSTTEHRRAALIQEKLPHLPNKPFVFGNPLPQAPMGSWTLWDKGRLLASPVCSSHFPHGRLQFAEDKSGPPNRAYLKIWEALTRLNARPGPGQLCLDLGSSPGGWTWALARLGARVFSVDKAPLAPSVERMPGVEYCSGSAFAVEGAWIGPVDWLFCDIACYPDRLLGQVRRWLRVNPPRNLVCTIKFAGETDFPTLREFLAIPGSSAFHLFHNKHEVTWYLLNHQEN